MILDQIAAAAKVRVEKRKAQRSLTEMKELAKALAAAAKVAQTKTDVNTTRLADFAFEKALQNDRLNYICEVKKASPSKGLIAEHFPYTQIARAYEEAGAACVSVLTEPDYFLGSDDYLTAIKKEIQIPVLRKDFTVDEYQIYEAKVIGADCVLLIGALLTPDVLEQYLQLCDELGLSAITEAHDEEEVCIALGAGSRMIGVNNRDLRTFEVDIQNSRRLRGMVPPDILFIAESGIRTAQDIAILKEAQVNGVLIGETLMRCEDKRGALKRLDGNV